jgi:hypothetical protein
MRRTVVGVLAAAAFGCGGAETGAQGDHGSSADAAGATTGADAASSGGPTGGPTSGSGAGSSAGTGGAGAGGSGAGASPTSGTGAASGTGGSTAAVVKIIAIGDTGEGNAEQSCVAQAMSAKCGLVGGCDAVMLNGDNFYQDGVKSTADQQWASKFELPYDQPNLNGLMFYAVLGNHDYGATSSGSKQAQIDYHYLPVGMGPGTRPSDKWFMPASYYDVPLGQGLVHLFAIDTQDTGSKQLNDMKQRVATSNATWKIVFGHHPRHTSGEHQLDNTLLDGLTKLTSPPGMFALQEGIYCGADMFMTGHDHDRELIEKGHDPKCPDTWFAISGAGAKVRSSKYKGTIAKSLFYDEDIEGFAYLEITPAQMLFEFYDVPLSDCAGAASKTPAFGKVLPK